jgi:hypothetical protein
MSYCLSYKQLYDTRTNLVWINKKNEKNESKSGSTVMIVLNREKYRK